MFLSNKWDQGKPAESCEKGYLFRAGQISQLIQLRSDEGLDISDCRRRGTTNAELIDDVKTLGKELERK